MWEGWSLLVGRAAVVLQLGSAKAQSGLAVRTGHLLLRCWQPLGVCDLWSRVQPSATLIFYVPMAEVLPLNLGCWVPVPQATHVSIHWFPWVWFSSLTAPPTPALPSPSVPLQVSETLVQRNGDFLIRDSLTSLGDYVLTCRWRNQALHFKINKVVVKAGESYTHIQYLFEQESFDHVPALVRYHVGSRKAVSEQSGAIIYCPVNRTFPLRYLEASYGLSQAGSKAASPASPSGPKGSHMKRRSVTMTDVTTDKVTRADACPTRSAGPCPAHVPNGGHPVSREWVGKEGASHLELG